MGLFAAISVISLVEGVFFVVQSAGIRWFGLRIRRVGHELTVVAPINLPLRKRIFSKCTTFLFTIMDKSDIHGLHYIVKKNKSIGFRLFWLTTVLVSSAVCLWQIFDTFELSEMNPIEYAIDEKMWDIKDVRNVNLKETLN